MADWMAGSEELGKVAAGCGCLVFTACAVAGAIAGILFALQRMGF